MNPVVSLANERDVYANLLRDSRGLRRDQASARDAWYASLPWDQKEQSLFELEMLLKGTACFGNPRNHPGAPRATAAVAHDFQEELRIVREGMIRVNSLVRNLLGDREKAYTFSRYLETVIPEDSTRGQLLQEQLTQDTPDESLFVLRNAFGSIQDLIDGVLRLDHVPNRLYLALHGTIAREVGRNVFFNPLMALEFRQEFDRIRNAEVLEALHTVRADAAHRVVALTMLSLFRVLRYLELVDHYASSPTSARRAYLLLAVLRSDLRALTRYLGDRAGKAMADGLERDIMAVHAVEVHDHRAHLVREIEWLSAVRSALETAAHGLRVDVRKIFRHDLPAPSEGMPGSELGPALILASAGLRASVHHAIHGLCRVLAPGRSAPQLALDMNARRAASERLRREVWMFMQILRAFIAKAQATGQVADRWAGAGNVQFVRDFLQHFRAIGYQLVRANDYERLDPFLAALGELRDVDLLEEGRMREAITECTTFYGFLEELFREISQRSELRKSRFDRRDATETLKVYLGR
ncbi:MAG: hypothetical protein AB8I08_39075 [Sandaracinaceae bacterium]